MCDHRPEKIENVYAQSSYVNQIFVYGDPYQASLVAIVVPDKEVFARTPGWRNLTMMVVAVVVVVVVIMEVVLVMDR